MVSALAAAWLLAGLSSGGVDADAPVAESSIRSAPGAAAPGGDASAPVKAALERGNYPWYDPKSDTVRPVWPPREWDFERLSRWLRMLKRGAGIPGIGNIGDLITIGLAMLGLTVFVVALIELWRRYRPEKELDATGMIRSGSAARIEDLPLGVRPEAADPWAEALARRARGDFAGAIVCLFAHQLLTLDRLRQIRLVPGRTGRQYVRAIDDRRFRSFVEPTLGLFEAVYYGHHIPSAEAFERVWALAEAFERHVATGVVA
jgi:Domain of unknown function (DUF4129)